MKTYLITGASGEIGTEIVKSLISDNNLLILVYNHHKIQKDILNKKNVISYQCDLSNFDALKVMINDIIKEFKKIDVLINCAGVSLIKQIQDTTETDYNFIFDNNLKSTIMLTSLVSKYMISEQSGNIINISSMWGKVGASMESLYSASKGAINSFTLALAKELGPSKINVNAVCPGFIDTKMNKHLTKEEVQDFASSTPLCRIGSTKDVAGVVKFLTSEDASFITGQLISVDGGFSL